MCKHEQRSRTFSENCVIRLLFIQNFQILCGDRRFFQPFNFDSIGLQRDLYGLLDFSNRYRMFWSIGNKHTLHNNTQWPCISFFQIVQHFDLSIGILCFCVFVSGSNLFLYCYFGGRATIDIVSYANILFESSWYKLPIELQKFIIVMIANGQAPIHYHGFGIAHLNLGTFLGVIFKLYYFVCLTYQSLLF